VQPPAPRARAASATPGRPAATVARRPAPPWARRLPRPRRPPPRRRPHVRPSTRPRRGRLRLQVAAGSSSPRRARAARPRRSAIVSPESRGSCDATSRLRRLPHKRPKMRKNLRITPTSGPPRSPTAGREIPPPPRPRPWSTRRRFATMAHLPIPSSAPRSARGSDAAGPRCMMEGGSSALTSIIVGGSGRWHLEGAISH
jgi:hypothetical protein